MIKRVIGAAGSWTTYYAGHVMAKIAYSKLGKRTGFFYRIYGRLMAWSVGIQDWAGNKGPWEKVEKPKNL